MNQLKLIKASFVIVVILIFYSSCVTKFPEVVGTYDVIKSSNIIPESIKAEIVEQPKMFDPILKLKYENEAVIEYESYKVLDNKQLEFSHYFQNVETQSLKFEKINVICDTITKQYTTDSEGYVVINLFEDFQLKERQSNDSIIITLRALKNIMQAQIITLEPRAFMLEMFKIKYDNGWLYKTNSANSEKIGLYKKNDRFIVKNYFEKWVEVFYNNESAWLPRSAGMIIYSIN